MSLYHEEHRATRQYACDRCGEPILVGSLYKRTRVAPWYEFTLRPRKWRVYREHIEDAPGCFWRYTNL